MKIVFDYQIFYMQRYGGISRYFSKLADLMPLFSNEIKIIAPIHQNAYIQSNTFGLKLKFTPKYIGRIINFINRYITFFYIYLYKPDILHETYYFSSKNAANAKINIITVYDMIHEIFTDEFDPKDITTYNKKIAISRADHIICISQNTKKDLCRIFNIDENKVSVVHLGFEKYENNFIKNKPLNLKRPYLLYVGARDGYKNFTTLLIAVASNPELKDYFDIVAFGASPFNEIEINIIRKLDFKHDSVRHLSGGDDVLGALYNDALAFIYPSKYEGFGLPPLEAMAHDCPVICSNTSSMPEVVGTAGEYFNPYDPNEINNAICNVVFNKDRRQELINLGRERIKLFSWDRCVEETLSVYRKILDIKVKN